jgi:hypothetical protein
VVPRFDRAPQAASKTRVQLGVPHSAGGRFTTVWVSPARTAPSHRRSGRSPLTMTVSGWSPSTVSGCSRRWPSARRHTVRCARNDGSRPCTDSRSPGRRGSGARRSSRCAPASRPRSPRSSGDEFTRRIRAW